MNFKIITMIGIIFILSINFNIYGKTSINVFNDSSEFDKNMDISEIALTSFIGQNDNRHIGYDLSNTPGDINGDGLCDLLIGDHFDDTMGTNAGRVMLILGRDNLTERQNNNTNPDFIFYGTTEDSMIGQSISFLGDINGDGCDDIAIGDPDYVSTQYMGKLNIFFGNTGSWEGNTTIEDADLVIYSSNSGIANFAKREGISGVGDINGDGIDDFIVADRSRETPSGGTGRIYLLFGKNNGWISNIDVESICDASYEGDNINDAVGVRIIKCGDINDDGYNDIALTAPWTVIDGETSVGRIYAIFGKNNGWLNNVSLSEADVSIDGENTMDCFGNEICSNGDVNGDGINDIFVCSPYNGEGGYDAGKAYLFLGRSNGWENISSASQADAAIIGTNTNHEIGKSCMISTDINDDNIHDILISSTNYANEHGSFVGKVYTFFGKYSGWNQSMDVSMCDASFIDYNADSFDLLGYKIVEAGDLFGSGEKCMIISAPSKDEGGSNRGKLFVLPCGIVSTSEPFEILSLNVFSDNNYHDEVSVLDKDQMVYIQILGIDGNASTRDSTSVNISYNQSNPMNIKLKLRETDFNTGIYRGKLKIPDKSIFGEIITISSVNDPLINICIIIDTPIRLNELSDQYKIQQYEELQINVSNLGYFGSPIWNVDHDSSWITFDSSTNMISGHPMNIDVGKYEMNISLSDGLGHNDTHHLQIIVENIVPVILTEDKSTILQNNFYFNDYNSSEDDDGDMTWSYTSNASWLEIVEKGGLLRGTPSNDDVGWYWVRVIVNDGNGGKGISEFNLTVINKNDPPTIIAMDVTEIEQGNPFRLQYEVDDIDIGDEHTWHLSTDAGWLDLNEKTGLLSGTPGPSDIGFFHVAVTVTDSGGLLDKQEFQLEVININDHPFFIDAPEDIIISNGDHYSFDVNASDLDSGTDIIYSISSIPYSNIFITEDTGEIDWESSINWFEAPPYRLKVTVTISDNEVEVNRDFIITIRLTEPPSAELLSPEDCLKLSKEGLILKWGGMDPDNDPVHYDVYLSDIKAFVTIMKNEVRLIELYNDTSLDVSGIDTGKWYYWSVVPHDGGSYGSCINGIHSFYLNTPPSVEMFSFIEIELGEELKFKIDAEDKDVGDSANIRYCLIEGPSGMSLGENNGLLRWKPNHHQSAMHLIKINVTDGIDTVSIEFIVEVIGNGDSNSVNSTFYILVFGSIIGILIVLMLTIFLVRRRGLTKEDSDDTDNGSREQIIGSPDEIEDKKFGCDVSLTPTEAHAHLGKGSREVSYEDLYGASNPLEEDEGLSAKELKAFIREQIENLEEMEE